MTEELKAVVLEKASKAAHLGALTEIVGSWVWARFDVKPPREVLTEMKAAAFRWNPKRKVWQFAGTPSRRSPVNADGIKAKYGAQAVILEEDRHG